MNSDNTIRIHAAISADHLRRIAIIYIRQSTQDQVRNHTGSAAFQRSLAAVALSYGWTKSQIQIIEDDLGRSGSSTEGRTGWQRLQDMTEADQVGAVFAANISRLSRQLSDFELFRLRAAYHNVLLYIDGRFLNPADSNDTVVSQITAMVAQFENRKRAELIMQSKLAKAKRGEMVSKLPMGWIKTKDGQYDYDPAVKEAIAMIVNTFCQTKSLGHTVKQLAEARIRIAYRARSHRLGFRRITPERVRFILTHPAYAGTYVYGISRLQASGAVLSSGGDAEAGCITNHDHHPPYMSREQQAEIKAILETSPKRPYRRGRCRAITSSFFRCAICGETVEVSRPVRVHRYRCRRRVEDTKKPCLNFSSNDLEPCILREVLRVLKAPPIHALKEALKASLSEKRMLIARIDSERKRLAREERAAQERVDCTVGDVTRIHFNALEKLEKVLQEKDRLKQKSALVAARLDEEPAEEDLKELCRIAIDVRSLWQHELVTDQERKQILGYLIDHIVINATYERIDATIVWKSGCNTSVFVWRAFHRRNLVRELHGQKAAEFYREGRSLQWIADHFNQQGFASASRRSWTAAMIRYLLYITGYRTEPLDRLHYKLIAEGRARRQSYRQIANEFNKKKIRRLGIQIWTARNVEKRWTVLQKFSDEPPKEISEETETSPNDIFEESA